MNATVDQFKNDVSAINNEQDFIDLIKNTMNTIKAQESEQWWADQSEKLDNAKQAVLGKLGDVKDWTVEKWQQVSAAVSKWFDEVKQTMSKAWGDFKEYAGQKMENFKEAMQQFGEKIAEMWGKAMESLGKLWDEVKIGAHNLAVDAKAMMQNLGTDMYYGAANVGIAVQKGVLAMDDAFQSVKGTVSQAVSDKFGQSAGQLLSDSKLATKEILEKTQVFSAMDFTGNDPKTVASAKEYQTQVLNKMQQEQTKIQDKSCIKREFKGYF